MSAAGDAPAAKVVETPVEIPTPVTRTEIQTGSDEFRALKSNIEQMMQFLGSISIRIDATEAARIEAQEVALGEIQELKWTGVLLQKIDRIPELKGAQPCYISPKTWQQMLSSEFRLRSLKNRR